MPFLLPQAARDLLNKPRAHALVVTTNRDGSPHATFVWAEEHDGILTFNAVTGGVSGSTCAATRRSPSPCGIRPCPRTRRTCEGTAVLSEVGADEQIDRLSKKYTGRESYGGHNDRERHVSGRVDVTRITGMGPWVASLPERCPSREALSVS